MLEMDSNQWSESYYSVLGVESDSSMADIRRAYRKLAMRWHPDRWTRTPSLLGESKRKFQQIQEAYSVLSDQRKRTMYDAGLYDSNIDEEDNGFSDFLEEILSLALKDSVKREGKSYSMEELQQMFMDMVRDFDDSPSCFEWSTRGGVEECRRSKRGRWESDSTFLRDYSHVHV